MRVVTGRDMSRYHCRSDYRFVAAGGPLANLVAVDLIQAKSKTASTDALIATHGAKASGRRTTVKTR